MRALRDLSRLLDPRHLKDRLAVVRRGEGASPTHYFVAHNRNHVRLMVGAASRLIAAGNSVYFVHLDGKGGGGVARPEFERLGLPFVDFDQLRARIRPRDILITGNDFGPWKPYKRFLDSVNRGLVTVVGIIEGARAIRRHRYERVDYVLAPGPAALEYFSKPVYVVGSPVIEGQVSTCGANPRAGRFVLINFKGDPDNDRDKRELAAVIQACEQIGVPCRVSVHPNIAMRVAQSSSAEFSDMLPEALALVTRPSTTAYEAMACGIPVVIFPPAAPLVEFATPYDAFTVSTPETLVGDLKYAIASRPNFKAASAKFLAKHLSIEPGLESAQRIADALCDIVRTRK